MCRAFRVRSSEVSTELLRRGQRTRQKCDFQPANDLVLGQKRSFFPRLSLACRHWETICGKLQKQRTHIPLRNYVLYILRRPIVMISNRFQVLLHTIDSHGSGRPLHGGFVGCEGPPLDSIVKANAALIKTMACITDYSFVF